MNSASTWRSAGLLLSLACSPLACSSDGSGESSSSATWCDAAPVVAARCNGCHADEPRNGAPFPLVEYEHFLADLETPEGGSLPRFERAQAVVESGHMPPPGSEFGSLSCAERATLLGWLSSNPSGPEPSCDAETPTLVPCGSAAKWDLADDPAP